MKIEIQNLNQIYPNGNHTLKNVNLEFGTGMFGLLGPNGAGKSSLMRILVTLMKPTSGLVLVDGKDIQKHRKEVRSMLGYLPQDLRLLRYARNDCGSKIISGWGVTQKDFSY
jgi:ABC-type multidrug transport system ATPase subunit